MQTTTWPPVTTVPKILVLTPDPGIVFGLSFRLSSHLSIRPEVGDISELLEPDLVVLDVTGARPDHRYTGIVARLSRAGVRVVFLSDHPIDLPPARVVQRPFKLKHLADVIREALAEPMFVDDGGAPPVTAPSAQPAPTEPASGADRPPESSKGPPRPAERSDTSTGPRELQDAGTPVGQRDTWDDQRPQTPTAAPTVRRDTSEVASAPPIPDVAAADQHDPSDEQPGSAVSEADAPGDHLEVSAVPPAGAGPATDAPSDHLDASEDPLPADGAGEADPPPPGRVEASRRAPEDVPVALQRWLRRRTRSGSPKHDAPTGPPAGERPKHDHLPARKADNLPQAERTEGHRHPPPSTMDPGSAGTPPRRAAEMTDGDAEPSATEADDVVTTIAVDDDLQVVIDLTSDADEPSSAVEPASDDERTIAAEETEADAGSNVTAVGEAIADAADEGARIDDNVGASAVERAMDPAASDDPQPLDDQREDDPGTPDPRDAVAIPEAPTADDGPPAQVLTVRPPPGAHTGAPRSGRTPTLAERARALWASRGSTPQDPVPSEMHQRLAAFAPATHEIERLVEELPLVRDLPALLRAITTSVAEELAADTVGLWRATTRGWLVAEQVGFTPREAHTPVPYDQPLLREVDTNGGAMLIDPIYRVHAAVAGIGGAHTRSIMAAAIATGPERHGLLTVGRDRPLVAADLDHLAELALEAALSIAVAEHLERIGGLVSGRARTGTQDEVGSHPDGQLFTPQRAGAATQHPERREPDQRAHDEHQ